MGNNEEIRKVTEGGKRESRWQRLEGQTKWGSLRQTDGLFQVWDVRIKEETII